MARRDVDIVAAFPDTPRAERAAKVLERHGVPKRHLHLVRPSQGDPARIAEMRGEMQEEVDRSVAGPGVVLTSEQAAGAGAGTVVGAVAGLVVGLAIGTVWAFAFSSEMSAFVRIALPALSFLVGGAVIGFVVGGAMKPRVDAAKHPGAQMDERRLAGERDTLLEVHVRSDEEARSVEDVLARSGAEQVHAIGADGTPLPPQSERPRPADPPGYWRENGKRG